VAGSWSRLLLKGFKVVKRGPLLVTAALQFTVSLLSPQQTFFRYWESTFLAVVVGREWKVYIKERWFHGSQCSAHSSGIMWFSERNLNQSHHCHFFQLINPELRLTETFNNVSTKDVTREQELQPLTKLLLLSEQLQYLRGVLNSV